MDITPDYVAMRAVAKHMVAVAMEEHARGAREIPPGSNRGPDVDRYLRGVRGDGVYLLTLHGSRGAPWCARFALWCLETACARLNCAPPTVGAGDLASTWKWREWAERHGRLSYVPHAGAVALILPASPSPLAAIRPHTAMVIRVGNEKLVTVEGNKHHRVEVVLHDRADFAGGFVDVD